MRRVVGLLGATAIALVMGASAAELVDGHAEALEQGERQAANLSRALAYQAARTFAEADRVLNPIVDTIAVASDPRPAHEASLHALLRERLRSAPQFSGAGVLDANGLVVANSHVYPAPRLDISDRDYFAAHRGGGAPRFRIGGIVTSRATGESIIVVSQAIRGGDGSFRGVLVGALRPAYFTEVYRTFDIGSAGRVELMGASGMVLARAPATDGVLGTTSGAFAAIAPLRPGQNDGIVGRHSGADGIERILAFSRVGETGLVVVVGLARAEVLEAWYEQFVAEVAVSGLIVVILLTLTLLALRHIGRLAATKARLHEQTAVLQSVFESVADGVIVTDCEQRFIFVNPASARLLGRPQPALIGRKAHEALRGPDGPTAEIWLADGSGPVPPDARPFRLAARNETLDDAPYQLRRSDVAEPMHISVTTRQLFDQSRQSRGAVVVLRDETQRRRLETQLQHARRVEALGKLTGGVAHDFNNLLLVILGGAERLAEETVSRSEQQRRARMIMDAGQRAADLTRQLLAFGRRQILEPRDIALPPLVERMTGMMRRVLGEHIRIETKVDPDTAVVRADEAQLEVALLNLACNARDAMPGGGTLVLETRNIAFDAAYAAANPGTEPGDYVMIAVSDTGVGMPPDVLERAIEPFYTTKPIGAGTGLGLSSVHGFALQSGGHLKLYSEPGHGTVVKLFFPRAAAADAARPAALFREAPRGQGETIMLVEDDRMVRAIVGQQLRQLGYDVIECADSRPALEALSAGAAPDLLFTDVIMPGGMNGVQLAETARRLHPDLEVLLTSGYSGDAIDAVSGGTFRMIEKPYRVVELAEAIRAALDRRPRRNAAAA